MLVTRSMFADFQCSPTETRTDLPKAEEKLNEYAPSKINKILWIISISLIVTWSPSNHISSNGLPIINKVNKEKRHNEVEYREKDLKFSKSSSFSFKLLTPAAIGPVIVGKAWKKGVNEFNIMIGIAIKGTYFGEI